MYVSSCMRMLSMKFINEREYAKENIIYVANTTDIFRHENNAGIVRG